MKIPQLTIDDCIVQCKQSPFNSIAGDILEQEQKTRSAHEEGKLAVQVLAPTGIELETHERLKVSNKPKRENNPLDPMQEDPKVDMFPKLAQFPDDNTEPMDKDIKQPTKEKISNFEEPNTFEQVWFHPDPY